jgi:hypothetical protein
MLKIKSIEFQTKLMTYAVKPSEFKSSPGQITDPSDENFGEPYITSCFQRNKVMPVVTEYPVANQNVNVL